MATLPLSWNPFWKLCTVHTAEQQDEAALEMHGKRWLRMHLLQRSCFPSLFRHALLQHVSQKLKCNVWSFRHGVLQHSVLAKSGPAAATLFPC